MRDHPPWEGRAPPPTLTGDEANRCFLDLLVPEAGQAAGRFLVMCGDSDEAADSWTGDLCAALKHETREDVQVQHFETIADAQCGATIGRTVVLELDVSPGAVDVVEFRHTCHEVARRLGRKLCKSVVIIVDEVARRRLPELPQAWILPLPAGEEETSAFLMLRTRGKRQWQRDSPLMLKLGKLYRGAACIIHGGQVLVTSLHETHESEIGGFHFDLL